MCIVCPFILCLRASSLLNRCFHAVLLLALLMGGGARAHAQAPLDTAEALRLQRPISVGDQLRIETWREELYSGVFTVDAAGRVTLPQVGVWTVTGLTADALRDRLTAAWGETLRDPLVQVTVLRRIRVLGEVLSPGVFYLDETFSVADALAMAGGRTPLAREGDVRFRRGADETLIDVRIDAQLSDLEVQTGDELFVPREGWWNRNLIPVVGAVGGLLGLAVALVLR
jgi:polysaccharide export outer membrane protein